MKLDILMHYDVDEQTGEVKFIGKEEVSVDTSVKKVKGLLYALGLENQIKIAFDEWNLRGWYHPNVHTIKQGVTKEEYLYPRDKKYAGAFAYYIVPGEKTNVLANLTNDSYSLKVLMHEFGHAVYNLNIDIVPGFSAA